MIERDKLLLYNNYDNFYYTFNIDLKSCSPEERYFNCQRS